jgi:hypothetical protein
MLLDCFAPRFSTIVCGDCSAIGIAVDAAELRARSF